MSPEKNKERIAQVWVEYLIKFNAIDCATKGEHLDPARLFGRYGSRNFLTQSCSEQIREARIPYDCIVTMSAQSALFAASLANKLQVPFIQKRGTEWYVFNPGNFFQSEEEKIFAKTILAGSYSVLPYAVQLADKHKLGCAYVMDDNQTARCGGDTIPERSAVFFLTEEYDRKRKTAVLKNLAKKKCWINTAHNLSIQTKGSIQKKLNTKDRHEIQVLAVTDIVTTGEQQAKEITELRKAGFECEHLISLFTYDLSCAREIFQGSRAFGTSKSTLGKPCRITPLVTWTETFKAMEGLEKLSELGMKIHTEVELLNRNLMGA
jgi:hypothetical protein